MKVKIDDIDDSISVTIYAENQKELISLEKLHSYMCRKGTGAAIFDPQYGRVIIIRTISKNAEALPK